jgi:hypothetical protein
MFEILIIIFALFLISILSIVIVYNLLLIKIEKNKSWVINLALRQVRKERIKDGQNSEIEK